MICVDCGRALVVSGASYRAAGRVTAIDGRPRCPWCFERQAAALYARAFDDQAPGGAPQGSRRSAPHSKRRHERTERAAA